MANNGTPRPVRLNGNTYISIGLLLVLLSSLVATAVTWGKLQAQVQTKLDAAQAAQTYATKADMHDLSQQLDRRLCRIEDKLDRLLEQRGRAPGGH